jgi:trehalose 2-sulfotransferase
LSSNYLLCATPRTGTTLLCQYLTSTEVAGRPQSYFRRQGMTSYAEGWRIVNSDGTYSFSDYLIAARAAASTENGTIGIRVMWGTLDEMTAELGQLYPNFVSNDLALLEKAFGQLKFVYLYRNDMIAQAISLYRAEMTGHWHTVEGQKPKQPPVFDFDAIKSRLEMLEEHNLAWKNWFQKVGVRPLALSYEALSADPVASTKRTLDFLGLKLPEYKQLQAANQRLADEMTVAWIEQFNKHPQKTMSSMNV